MPAPGKKEKQKKDEMESLHGETYSMLSNKGWFISVDLPPCMVQSRMLRQNILDYLAMHVGQAHVAAAEAHGQALVIDAQKVQ